MSIKHRKGRRMGAFDWFIGDSPFLARCREILASFNGENFYLESWQENFYRRKWIQERNSEFYPWIFFFGISFFRLYCGHDVHRA